MFDQRFLACLVVAFMIALPTHLRAQDSTDPQPAPDTWEFWIQQTLKGLESPRPDNKPRMATLPTWVDCHLSWQVDSPRIQGKILQIPSEIILRSNPKKCDGQLEQWAR